MRKLLPLLLLLFALPAKAQTYGQAFFYSGGSAGGSGTVTSLTATAPVVITPSPTTTTGVISCATCMTKTIPTTVASATSGGIPCFDSPTDMNTSGAITLNDMIVGGGAGACAKDSSVLYTNLAQLSSASTQTFQSTANAISMIVKGPAGGAATWAAQSSGGTNLLLVNPGATPPVSAGSGIAVATMYNSVSGGIFWSRVAPTITGAGCGGSGASISTNNGTASFKVNVGTSNTGTCTVTMPGASTDWICSATDITTTSTSVSQTKSKPGGTPTTQITLQNYTDISGTGAWTDSDVIAVSCWAE